jgi:regulation of enolase protein 1 (concanavalin A-like superfamily)
MRRAVLRVLLIGLVIIMLGSLPLACLKKSTSTESTKTATGGGQTSTGTSPSAGTTTTSTGTSATGTGPGGMPSIVDNKELASYRFTIMTKVVEGMGAGMVNYMKYEWVKAQQAEHAWMEDANGKVQEVYIHIGDKEWMYMPGMGWIEQPPQTTTPAGVPSDLADQIKHAEKSRFDKKGSETVNNVKCIKYEFEYDMTMETPNLGAGGTIKTDIHSTGNVWIADQGDLPAVMIKSVSTSNMVSSGTTTVVESEQNLTDIGANITINPPEGAITPPTGLPTSPTTSSTTTSTTSTTTPPAETTMTTTTTITTTTTPPAAGAPVFEDDFQGNLDSAWTWTDPNDDASYSLTARSGYLTMTVPDNNDLANATNYDAPRLLVPQSGDFTIETLVEFDPLLEYQGAGLLVWQDERNFLRLEYGFGGMGGGAKKVAFLRQKDYELYLAASYDLPDITKQMELRLVRQGDRFTAWYKQQGRSWMNLGSTDLSLDATVEVGIAQINQYNTYTISADFDYFKISTP